MKKNIKFLAIAAVASLTVAACNNNSTETTDTVDTTATCIEVNNLALTITSLD